MRVTENRMIQEAADAVSQDRDKAAEAARAMASGARVELPSTDEAAWEEGMRAEVRITLSQARGRAIGLAQDGIAETERSFNTIGESLLQVVQLTNQGANGTLSASERTSIAAQIQALRDHIVASADLRNSSGEYLLAGSLSAAAPFTPAGLYVGDGRRREVEVGESETQTVTTAGTALTVANGVDVIPTLDAIVTALNANNVPGVQAQIDNLNTAVGQVANARAELGTHSSALLAVDQTRREFEQHLVETHNRTMGIDPITAASNLQQSQQALTSAETVAQQVVDMVKSLQMH